MSSGDSDLIFGRRDFPTPRLVVTSDESDTPVPVSPTDPFAPVFLPNFGPPGEPFADLKMNQPDKVDSVPATEVDTLMTDQGRVPMALYEDEEEERPLVSRVIYRLANYDGGMVPNQDLTELVDEQEQPDTTPDGKKKKRKKKSKNKQSAKLGTVLGVYFPCVQNIFGVILFIRLVWVVGMAGWIEAFVLAFICCCCTMTTSISMSAIATNGVVPGGGSYFMISRSLGPEFGGAVGILFYLGTSVASSMYIVGAVEILLQYILPSEAAIFGPLHIPNNAYNAYRVYGSALLFIMFIFVFIGVKFVSKFSPIALFCVIFSILCVYIGIFVSSPSRGPKICFIGDRLLAKDKISDGEGIMQCHKHSNGTMWQLFCPNVTEYEIEGSSDPECIFFRESQVALKPGIPGLGSGKFLENAFSSYSGEGQRIGSKDYGSRDKGDILADISTSFIVLIGIFFPSVTGLMAGSNRSGDLADAQKSIPIGTIGAVATTSVVYLSTLLLFGACIEGQFLRDKIGESMGGGLIVAHLAWPNPWVIVIGSFFSTCGAGLQSLVGAPRLLQAIAADGVIPFLNPFAVTNKKGEPKRALYLTATIAECGVLLANVDYIAPIITMFFLMCYCFTNMACAVQTILKSPNWRPRFKLYHWCLSLFGVALCLTLMFLSSWYYAIMALLLAAGIYKYIEYKGAEKEWGDGIRGLAMSAARFALLRLEEGPPHVKNWRPQLLILLKSGETLDQKYRKLLTFSSQLKAGRGLTMVGSVLEGEHRKRLHEAESSKHLMGEMMKREKVKGFAEVIISRNLGDGISYLIQGAGVGGLRHNTVMLNWPVKWRQESRGYKIFIDTMKLTADRQLAVLIVKGINQFPENGDRLGGTIDIWWIVHEGGLLMLLPFLLTQGKVWKKCKMRIFTVAQMEDNNIQIQKDMEKFLYNLRIPAQVKVVEMPTNDISAYTYERTLMAEQRNALLEKMNLKRSSLTPQMIMDQAYLSYINHSPARTMAAHLQNKFIPIKADDVVLNVEGAHASGRFTVIPEKEDHPEKLENEAPMCNSIEDKSPEPSVENQRPNDVGKDTNNIIAASNNNNGSKQRRQGEQHPNGKHGDAESESDENFSNQGTGSASKSEDGKSTDGEEKKQPSRMATPTSPSNTFSRHHLKSQNVQRMQTAIRLNQMIRENSSEAKLVIVNLPGPPKDSTGEKSYMDFLEVLVEGLERVLMVKGGGKEVITIFS